MRSSANMYYFLIPQEMHYPMALYYVNKYVKSVNLNSDVKRALTLYGCYLLLSKELDVKELVYNIIMHIQELYKHEVRNIAISKGWYKEEVSYIWPATERKLITHTWLNSKFWVRDGENNASRFYPEITNLITKNIQEDTRRCYPKHFVEYARFEHCKKVNREITINDGDSIPSLFYIETYRNNGDLGCSVCNRDTTSCLAYNENDLYNLLFCGSFCKLLFYDELKKYHKPL